MESFPIFFRIRAAAFTVIMLFSFLWLALLCVQVFARWTVSDEISQSLMILFLLTNTITLVLLPVLILVKFRAWLDAARLLLLFVLQVGSATAGTYWSPKIQCPDQTPDDIGVCQLIGVYTIVACWIIPAILLLYSIYFAVVVYLQSRIPVAVGPKHPSGVDSEMGSIDSPSSWRGIMKEIVGVQQGSNTMRVQPRSLMLPTMVHTGQSSLPQSLSHPRSSLPIPPRRQSTMPSLPQAGQWHLPTPHPAPSRHQSLPAFKHVRPVLTLPVPHPPTANLCQTPSSYSYSSPCSANPHKQFLNFIPGHGDVQSASDTQWRSKHLSMMPFSSSPTDIQSAWASPRSGRARLSKPVPPHFM